MQCKNRFGVTGQLRLKQVRPIRTRSDLWEFEVNNGLVTHICITVRVLERQFWPKITPNPAPGVSFALQAIPPHTMFVQMELRTLQGLLSLFGVRSIDIPYPEIEWIPETDEERAYLKVHSFKTRRQEPSPESLPIVEFALLPVRFWQAGKHTKSKRLLVSFAVQLWTCTNKSSFRQFTASTLCWRLPMVTGNLRSRMSSPDSRQQKR